MNLKLLLLILIPTTILSQTTDSLNIAKDISTKQDVTQSYILKDGSTRVYSKPKFFDFVTKIPKDFIDVNKDYVAKDHAYYLGGAVASTLILIPFDQKLIDNSRELADRWGLQEANLYKDVLFFKIPENLGAGLYLLGNGGTVVALSLGFATYGLLKDDYRAQTTASGLMESLILSGVFTQTIKRITGRESPFIAKENGNSGGHWTPFPSFAAYAKNTPHYDAMPSGHLTTFMSALTVIADNYPDTVWIKPVGYTLAGVLCFQMMQSQVHWISDYPLALFMGYFIGKNISKNRYKTINSLSKKEKYKVNLLASKYLEYNMVGLNITF